MLSFRNYFEAKESVDVPDWFYVACKLNKDVLEKSPKTPEGAVATLFNLEGITDKFSSFTSFLNDSMFGIKMPGKETLELNKLSKIDYNNLDYLASRGFRAARRIEAGMSRRVPLEKTFKSLLTSFFQNHFVKDKNMLYDKNHESYLVGTDLSLDDIIEYLKKYNPYEKNAFWKKTPKKSQLKSKNNLKNFNNFNDLTFKLFKLLKIYLPHIEITKDSISNKLQKAFADMNSFSTVESESEWVTKRQPEKFNVKIGGQNLDLNLNINQLHVPEGSTVYADINTISKDKSVKDLFPEIKDPDKLKNKIIEKLQKKYNVLEVDNLSGFSIGKKDLLKNKKEKEDEDKIISLLNSKESYEVKALYRAAKLKNVDKASVSKILKQLIHDKSIFIKDNVIRKNDELIKNSSLEEDFLREIKESPFNFLTVTDINILEYGRETLKSIINNLRKEKKILIKNKIIFLADVKTYPTNEKVENDILKHLEEKNETGLNRNQAKLKWENDFKSFTKLLYENKIVFLDELKSFYSIDNDLKNTTAISSFLDELKKDFTLPIFKLNTKEHIALLRTGLVFDDGKNLYLKSSKFKNPFIEDMPKNKIEKDILDIVKKHVVLGFSGVIDKLKGEQDNYISKEVWNNLVIKHDIQRRVNSKGELLTYYVDDEDYDYMKKAEVKKFIDLIKKKKVLDISELDGKLNEAELRIRNIILLLEKDDVIFTFNKKYVILSEYKNDSEVLDFIQKQKNENLNKVKNAIEKYTSTNLQPFTIYNIMSQSEMDLDEPEIKEALSKIENIKKWESFFWTNDIDLKNLDKQIMDFTKQNLVFTSGDLLKHMLENNRSQIESSFISLYSASIIRKNESLSKFIRLGYHTFTSKENYNNIIKENKDIIDILNKYVVSAKYVADYLQKDLEEINKKLNYLSELGIIKSGMSPFTSTQFFWRHETKYNRYIELIEMVKNELLNGPLEYEDLLNRLKQKIQYFYALLNLLKGNPDTFDVVENYPKITVSLKK